MSSSPTAKKRRCSYKRHADPLLIIMTKNTLLAVISISCTFLVIIVLIYLYIKHLGDYVSHTDMEEFALEFVILVDIVSNFICILLSYQFFDAEYNRFCKCCNKHMHTYLNIEMEAKIKRLHSKKSLTVLTTSTSPPSMDIAATDTSMDIVDIEDEGIGMESEMTRTATKGHVEMESTMTQTV